MGVASHLLEVHRVASPLQERQGAHYQSVWLVLRGSGETDNCAGPAIRGSFQGPK